MLTFINIYLGNSTRPLNVDFSTGPLVSTFIDVSTERVNTDISGDVLLQYILMLVIALATQLIVGVAAVIYSDQVSLMYQVGRKNRTLCKSLCI